MDKKLTLKVPEQNRGQRAIVSNIRVNCSLTRFVLVYSEGDVKRMGSAISSSQSIGNSYFFTAFIRKS